MSHNSATCGVDVVAVLGQSPPLITQLKGPILDSEWQDSNVRSHTRSQTVSLIYLKSPNLRFTMIHLSYNLLNPITGL